MENSIPTQQELSGYFFNRCTPEVGHKIEQWFLAHGKSQEARELLFSLWEELEETTTVSPEETEQAFIRFKEQLLIDNEPEENESESWASRLLIQVQRIAAILILPLILVSGYLFYQSIIRKSKFSKNPKRSVHKIEGLEKRSVQKSSYAHGQESTEEICFFGAFLLLYILVILQ